MKKQTGFQNILLKSCLLFLLFCCLWGEKEDPKTGKNISQSRKNLEKRVSLKFESYMMGKTGVWHLRKNLVLFGPPDMQKTQEFPGLFGVVSFLLYPSGRVEQKRYQLLAPPLAYITREARAISPRRRGPYHLRAFPLL